MNEESHGEEGVLRVMQEGAKGDEVGNWKGTTKAMGLNSKK